MAVEPGDATFQSCLDEKSKKKAKDELNELNDKDRELAVQSLRKWVLEQPWLKSPTDFEFLLRFLRVRKFSQLEARKSIENYWTVKSKHPDWFHNIDPADEKIKAVFRSGLFLTSPKLDSQGRVVFIGREYMLPVETIKKEFGIKNMMRAVILNCEWVAMNENLQVNGLIAFEDMTNMSMGHITNLWNKEVSSVIMKFFEKGLPTRYKGTHMYQEPVFIDTIMALFKPLMPKKWIDRLWFHGKSLAKVYGDIDMHCLPDEYLPDDYEGPRLGSVADFAETMIQEMNKPEIRDYLLKITSSEYGVDLDLKKNERDTPAASFRKLNVD